MLKKTKSISKSVKKLLKSKKGFFVDTGVKILICVVLGSLVLGGLYTTFNSTIMPSVKSKVESMFEYSDGGSSGGGSSNGTEGLEEKYQFTKSTPIGYNKGAFNSSYQETNGPRENVVCVKLNGETLSESDYTLYGGPTTQICFDYNFVQTLTTGVYSLVIIYDDDAYAEGELDVTVIL